MARIEYCDLSSITPELAQMLTERRALNFYRMLSHGGDIAIGFLQFGDALKKKMDIPADLREMVILRTAHQSNGHYELHKHTWRARKLGIPDWKINSVLSEEPKNDFDRLSAKEKATLQFVDAIVKEGRPSDRIFQNACSRLSRKELVEVLMLTGFYLVVGKFIDTFDVEIEHEEWDYSHDNPHFQALKKSE